MRNVLDAKAVHELVSRSVTALAGGAAARSVAPPLEAALDLARKTASAGSSAKRKSVITAVKVSVGPASDGGVEPVTTVFKTRQPIDAGPKKRVPIRNGGGTCFTIKIGKISVTVCIDWES